MPRDAKTMPTNEPIEQEIHDYIEKTWSVNEVCITCGLIHNGEKIKLITRKKYKKRKRYSTCKFCKRKKQPDYNHFCSKECKDDAKPFNG